MASISRRNKSIATVRAGYDKIKPNSGLGLVKSYGFRSDAARGKSARKDAAAKLRTARSAMKG